MVQVQHQKQVAQAVAAAVQAQTHQQVRQVAQERLIKVAQQSIALPTGHLVVLVLAVRVRLVAAVSLVRAVQVCHRVLAVLLSGVLAAAAVVEASQKQSTVVLMVVRVQVTEGTQTEIQVRQIVVAVEVAVATRQHTQVAQAVVVS